MAITLAQLELLNSVKVSADMLGACILGSEQEASERSSQNVDWYQRETQDAVWAVVQSGISEPDAYRLARAAATASVMRISSELRAIGRDMVASGSRGRALYRIAEFGSFEPEQRSEQRAREIKRAHDEIRCALQPRRVAAECALETLTRIARETV
jgi:hypothetical protein